MLNWFDVNLIPNNESLLDYPDVLYHLNLGKKFTILSDRTDMVKFPIKTNRIIKIKPLTDYTVSFSDACDLRANEILSQSNDKLIYIMWSGGTDSTCMLSAMIKNSTASQKQKFVILLSTHSIRENPEFFNDFIIGKLKYQNSLTYLDSISDQSDILLHAECSDQLFPEGAPIGDPYLSQNDLWHLPYSVEHVGNIWKSMLYDRKKFKEFQSLCQKFLEINIETAASCNVELKTVLQVKTWFTMNFAFTFKLFQPYNVGIGNLQPECFYYSDSFDQWAMKNIMKTKRKNTIFKKEAKDYIFDLDKNENYYFTKKKVGSGPILHLGRKRASALDSDFQPVVIERITDYYRPYNWIQNHLANKNF